MKVKRINPFIAMDSTLVCLISVVILAPVLNIFASSFASNRVLAEGNFIFFPKELTLDNYMAVFKDVTIWHAYLISVLKTVIGVVTHVFFCSMVAFGLSKRDLKFRNLYTVMGVITLFFSGGMIPTYLLMKKLGLLKNPNNFRTLKIIINKPITPKVTPIYLKINKSTKRRIKILIKGFIFYYD